MLIVKKKKKKNLTNFEKTWAIDPIGPNKKIQLTTDIRSSWAKSQFSSPKNQTVSKSHPPIQSKPILSPIMNLQRLPVQKQSPYLLPLSPLSSSLSQTSLPFSSFPVSLLNAIMLLLTNSLSFLPYKRSFSLPDAMPSLAPPPPFPFLNPNSRHLGLPPNPNSNVISRFPFLYFSPYYGFCVWSFYSFLVCRLFEEWDSTAR